MEGACGVVQKIYGIGRHVTCSSGQGEEKKHIYGFEEELKASRSGPVEELSF
jgi:hypothetical protein